VSTFCVMCPPLAPVLTGSIRWPGLFGSRTFLSVLNPELECLEGFLRLETGPNLLFSVKGVIFFFFPRWPAFSPFPSCEIVLLLPLFFPDPVRGVYKLFLFPFLSPVAGRTLPHLPSRWKHTLPRPGAPLFGLPSLFCHPLTIIGPAI